MLAVTSFTIYHSANSYLGITLLKQALADLPDVIMVRRPIFVPRERGILVAEMLGGHENRNQGGYNREDCARWARRYGIPLNYPSPERFQSWKDRWSRAPFNREELPARAYYAAPVDQRDMLDAALFTAAWIYGLDVNEPETIVTAADEAGLSGQAVLAAALRPEAEEAARQALTEFDAALSPGVPTMIVGEERFFGKDRVDWVRKACCIALRVAPETKEGLWTS